MKRYLQTDFADFDDQLELACRRYAPEYANVPPPAPFAPTDVGDGEGAGGRETERETAAASGPQPQPARRAPIGC